MGKRKTQQPKSPALADQAAGIGPMRTASPDLQKRIVVQVSEAIWMPKDVTPEERSARIREALVSLGGIDPQDELEGMLAAEMVATHHAAIDCLRRAMIPEQSLPARDVNLKHAARLLAIYARQLEVLDKHRGKGQQQMTVRYVNVGSGGQAVIGNVKTGGSVRAQRREGPRSSDEDGDPDHRRLLVPPGSHRRVRRDR
jgi:hypothetical protein